MGQVGQRRSSDRQVPSLRVYEPHAEGLGHPSSGVVGGAAADPDDEPPEASVQGMADGLAEPVGRRP